MPAIAISDSERARGVALRRTASLYQHPDMLKRINPIVRGNPHWADLFCQAPVLAIHHKEIVRDMATKQPSLKDVLDHFKMPKVMRGIVPTSILSLNDPIMLFRELGRVNPAELAPLAQATPHVQQVTLSIMDTIAWTLLNNIQNDNQRATIVSWFLRNILPNVFKRRSLYADTANVAAFFAANPNQFIPAMSLGTALTRAEDYVLETRRGDYFDSYRKRFPNFDKMVFEPFGRFPVKFVDANGTVFQMIRTPGELLAEGSKMQHCVASYAEFVIRGTSSIYHVENSVFGEGTLEIRQNSQGQWIIGQFKAKKNHQPHPALIEGAEAWFSKFLTKSGGLMKRGGKTQAYRIIEGEIDDELNGEAEEGLLEDDAED